MGLVVIPGFSHSASTLQYDPYTMLHHNYYICIRKYISICEPVSIICSFLKQEVYEPFFLEKFVKPRVHGYEQLLLKSL